MFRPARIAVALLALVMLGVVATAVRAGSTSVYIPIVYNFPPPFFLDNFSNPASGWPSGSVSGIATEGYNSGTYQILFQQGGYLVRAGHNLYVSDFQAVVDVWPAASTDGTIGLYFDFTTPDGGIHVSFYDFEVGIGGYFLARCDNCTSTAPTWATLIPFTPSSAILGGNQANHLKVLRQGASISLYANDQLLQTLADGAYTKGTVGLVASANTAPFDARFANFALYALSPTPTSATVARTQAVEPQSNVAIRKR